MPSLPFTLRQLEVFSALAESGSFRRCAEDLGISQASVSNQIKVLEEQLGVRLFDRKPGQRPLLTDEGRSFEDDLRLFYDAGQKLASHRRRGIEEERPVRYRLLVGQGMFDAYVRPKLDRFFAENPLIELQFDALPPSSEVFRLLTAGRFDFALVNLRVDTEIPRGMRLLAHVQGGIYGHRSFAKGKQLPLSPDEVNLLPFVLPQAGSRQERELLAALEKEGIRPRKVVGHSQYYDVMAAMLERGVAVASFAEAILPRSMRDAVIRLAPLPAWRLVLFRKHSLPDKRRDAVEEFIVRSIVADPDFPALEVADWPPAG